MRRSNQTMRLLPFFRIIMIQIAEQFPFQTVFLAGTPDYTGAYIQLLQMLNVNVAGVVSDDSPQELPVAVYSVKDYAGMKNYHDIPLIILDHQLPNRGGSFFFWFLAEFINNLDRSATTLPVILHSCVLAKYFQDFCKDFWSTTGFPGSGNIVLFYLCRNIKVPEELLKNRDGFQSLMYVLGIWQRHTLLQCCVRITSGIDVDYENMNWYVYLTPYTTNFRTYTKDGKYLVVNNLPDGQFIGRYYQGHDLWTDDSKTIFERSGWNVFYAVRNPINVMASNAAKTYRPLTHALYNDDWFNYVSNHFSIHMKMALEKRACFNEVRYEDVLAEPRKQILRIADIVGVKLDDGQADDIAGKVLFKKLHENPYHYNKPGSDKLGFFTPELIEIMESHGHRELAEAFGYEWPDKDKLPPAPETASRDEEPIKTNGVIDPCIRIYEEDRGLGVSWHSESGEIVNTLKENLKKDILSRVFIQSMSLFGSVVLNRNTQY